MQAAACPASKRIVLRSDGGGVTSATQSAAFAMKAMFGLVAASAASVERSRIATKCHGWTFFADWDRRPACRIVRTMSSGSGSSRYVRTARLVRMASMTFIDSSLPRWLFPVFG